MKIDLGDDFLFKLVKGDYVDVPVQEALHKEVMIQMLQRLNQYEEIESKSKLRDIFNKLEKSIEEKEETSAEIFPFKPDDKE